MQGVLFHLLQPFVAGEENGACLRSVVKKVALQASFFASQAQLSRSESEFSRLQS